jgi:hypothetical protein
MQNFVIRACRVSSANHRGENPSLAKTDSGQAGMTDKTRRNSVGVVQFYIDNLAFFIILMPLLFS